MSLCPFQQTLRTLRKASIYRLTGLYKPAGGQTRLVCIKRNVTTKKKDKK
jgi:hypothetical protein